jgi:hypothetical protein
MFVKNLGHAQTANDYMTAAARLDGHQIFHNTASLEG